jgi:transcriptional regulator with AAA-type ATPase domain
VGSGALWKQCSLELNGHYRSGDRLVLEGEPGSGKLALLRAVHQVHQPGAHFRVMDADECVNPEAWTQVIRQELEAADGVLVLQHLDRLSKPGLRAIAETFAEFLGRDDVPEPWVAATVGSVAEAGQELSRVLDYFPRSLSVPPLRHHPEDIRELVPFFLGRLAHGEAPVCSAEAMNMLVRHAWPGNVAQLQRMLRAVAQRRRSGLIHINDLPPEARTASRRILTPLEALERDAIVRSLQNTATNKKEAAEALGISRATIYRKIRDYGIEVHTSDEP